MSRLTETRQAYDRMAELLNQEIRKGGSNAIQLKRYRETLDLAFYLLGWAQFEKLVRKRTETIIIEQAKAKTIDGVAWRHLQENIKSINIRRRLDVVFHARQDIRASLDDDYDLRNEAAHNYKMLS